MNPNKIWLSSPHMGGTERNYVTEAFDTNWVAPLGPNVNGFEHDISAYLKGQSDTHYHTAALTSGTVALHLALIMLNVQPSDAVLVQSFTFCGTTNPVVYQGAELVFVDSERDTWNMDPAALQHAIDALLADGFGIPQKREPRQGKGYIRAILPVHLYGMPAKLDSLEAIAAEAGIPIVEDAAEALGSSFRGRKCGTFGVMSALSFNGNKIITTSGGGALVSHSQEYVEKARFLSTQARDNAPHYQHSEVGYNYRMSNIVAGIGRGQMEVLDERVAQRRANNHRYREYFQDIEGVELQFEPNEDYFSNFWLTAVLIDPERTGGIDREQVRLAMEAENIECRPLWKPMHLQPVFEGSRFFGTGVCEELFEKGLCLPSGSNLTEADFERIFAVLDSLFKTPQNAG
jgi:dTDP-4-amino-4,6-dideoxygalactose transaminase